MKTPSWLLPALALALVPLGCRAPATSVPADSAAEPEPLSAPEGITLARVNDESLTLRYAMDSFLSSHAGHGVLVRGEAAVRELAGRLVEQQLFLDEARSLGVPDDPSLVAAVQAYQRGQAEIVFWRRMVDERIDVPQEEVDAFYAKTDVGLRLSLIEVETQEAAEALRGRVLAGEDSAILAEAESTHPSRTFGGELDVVRGELEPALEEQAFGLQEPGEVSAVVATETGFAFVRLNERVENTQRPPPEVMLPRIRGILEGRQEDELRAAVEEGLRTDWEVRVEPELLTADVLLGEGPSEQVVAQSAGEELTLGDLQAAIDPDALRAAPPEEADEVLLEVAGSWALARAVAHEVERIGLIEDPDVTDVVENFRRDAILRTLYSDFVYAQVDASAEDVRVYYEEHLETEFTRPQEVHLAYLVTEGPEQARAAMERLEQGADFGELARELSVDPTSSMHGGRIGWIREGQLLPEVEERAFTLAPGELAGPVETEVGTFVLQALEIREAIVLPFESCRAVARQRVTKSLQQEAYRVWVQRLRERAEVELDEDGIQAAVAWLDNEAEAQAEAAAIEGVPPGIEAPPGHGGGAPALPMPPSAAEEGA